MYVLVYLFKSQTSQQSSPHPSEVGWLRNSHEHLTHDETETERGGHFPEAI